MQVSGLGGGASGAAMIQQMRERMFTRADKDGDGGLSLDEFKAIRRPPAGVSQGGSLGGSQGSAPAGSPADSAASPASGTAATTGTSASDAVASAFKALDADGDGKLTSAELEKGRRRHGGGQGIMSADGLQALLAVQERSSSQQSQGQSQAGGLQAVVARMLQAYGGTQAAA
ncbi:MAG: EF-hand domain pair [Belnapia sp.]|nr:EF-hand domain pair [Belnapia sp.]